MWAHSRSLWTVAIVFAIAVSVLLAVQGPAWANQEDECDPGEVCMFKDINYSGGWYDDVGDEYDYDDNIYDGCSDFFCGVNDETSSIDNDGTDCESVHYVDAGQDQFDEHIHIKQGDAEPDLRTRNIDDELSSHQWCHH